jgi:hypothetical protein
VAGGAPPVLERVITISGVPHHDDDDDDEDIDDEI